MCCALPDDHEPHGGSAARAGTGVWHVGQIKGVNHSPCGAVPIKVIFVSLITFALCECAMH